MDPLINPEMISATQRCLLSWESATSRSKWGCNTGRKASPKLRNKPWKNTQGELIFLLIGLWLTWSCENLTLNKQNLRGLNLSLPFRSSRDRNSMNWFMNTGSEKWSKVICSRWETKRVKITIFRCLTRYTLMWHVDLSHKPLSFPLCTGSAWAAPFQVHKSLVF